MRFVIDANLPPGLADWLNALGHDAHHVRDLKFDSANDRQIWDHAKATNACIVSKDEDFVLLTAIDPTGPSVVWIRIGNALNRVLIARLSQVWASVIDKLDQGEGVVEIR